MATLIETSKERLVKYLDNKGISSAKFYEDTGLKRGLIDKDKLHQQLTSDRIAIIVACYEDVSIDWLITGQGDMLKDFGSNSVNGTYLNDQEEYERAKKLGLSLIPEYTDTFMGGPSGSMIGSDAIKAYWSFPNIKADMIIEVEGDSMANTFPAGSKVAIKKIQFDPKCPTVGIPFGEAFGIVVDNDDENYITFIKRIRRHPDKELQNKYWIAQSDNTAYDDLEIEISKVRHLFIVVASIKLTGY